ncbi:RNA-binding protein [bacterium]|nr:RNA-binding protein [bacterium]
MRRLYVGNLSYSTNEDELRRQFEVYGEVVSATVIKDRETGRSKGFGFVEFAEDEAAQDAIVALNEREIDGRPIKVSEARPREEASRRPR